VCPVAQPEGHDAPRLVDEPVPSVAAVVDDDLVGPEDAVREPVVAHELPDVLHRVELGALGRQRDQCDVRRHRHLARQVPPGLIKQQHRVCPRRHRGGDLGEVQVHRLGVAVWEDQRRALALLGTDGTEDVGRRRVLIPRRHGTGTALGPAAGDLVLLPHPGLIGEPDLYRGRLDAPLVRDLLQQGGKGVLKSAMAPSAWA
jgi:hypothetical protein